ncbi:MAG: hypothetical protein G8345_05420 [Magnetococcales bacterium]|nr:hypothetical protein [Magnetococcales bacterium]NGZ26308.1 hypothetical protein [Magnetococcales bacterium]
MIDYTPYVMAVYGIALLVYGGSTLYWQRRLQALQAQLAESGENHGPA